ncbi:ABC transporter substrate-binding protein [Chelatococcus sp. YT9]|uniref:ABC transporter substrate-binding protein n=1 Tax=Chelatococcus sp. YT9 TaxID=2835635 RepID=UPI001BCE458B|nr:ABC transporter substrate-binding protein [Chelatococcus sp. YT9]MBS7700213.1 ABC transporter substrate-binding protein [Chelatococcus sp. YT9]
MSIAGRAFILAASLVAGIGMAEAAPDSLTKAGKIVFCSDLNSPPNQYMAEDGSTPTGVAIDMLKGIGDELKLPIEIMNVKFSGIFPALDTGQCDAIMASTSKSPERLKKYNFVDYWAVASGLLVKKGNPQNLKTYLDLSGKRVAVLLGSANQRRLETANEELTKLGKPPMEIAAFPGNTIAFQELDLGRVDAMVGDTLVLSYFQTRSNGKFEIGGAPVAPSTLGIIVTKPREDVAAAFRKALDDLQASGKLQAMADKWGVAAGMTMCTSAKPCP